MLPDNVSISWNIYSRLQHILQDYFLVICIDAVSQTWDVKQKHLSKLGEHNRLHFNHRIFSNWAQRKALQMCGFVGRIENYIKRITFFTNLFLRPRCFLHIHYLHS